MSFFVDNGTSTGHYKDMNSGTLVRVMSKDGKRLLFIGEYRYERGGKVRVFRMGHVTEVEPSQVKPLRSN